MCVLDTTSKLNLKLAIRAFVLFEIGWILFTIGFGLLLNHEQTLDEEQRLRVIPIFPLVVPLRDDATGIKSIRALLYYPYYMTLIGGQFVVALGLVQAGLPFGLASSIAGVFSKILNTIYFVFVGFVIVNTCLNLQLHVLFHRNDTLPDSLEFENLILAGTVLLIVGWSLAQLFSIFCKPQSKQIRSWWRMIVDFYSWTLQHTMANYNPTSVQAGSGINNQRITRGEAARLLSIPAILLSAVGWGILIGGVHTLNQHTLSAEVAYLYTLPTKHILAESVTIFITPLLYLAALLYAGSSRGASTIMGLFTSILNTFFIVCIGYMVTASGILLAYLPDSTLLEHLPQAADSERFQPTYSQTIHNIRLVLGGGVICIFFWIIVLILWQLNSSNENSTLHEQRDVSPPPSLQPGMAQTDFIEPEISRAAASSTQYNKMEANLNPNPNPNLISIHA